MYYYANNGASSTRFSDGKEVLEFPNGQKEIVNADGTREIIFPDNIREKTHLSGKKETFYQDGSRKILGINGDEVVFFRDGQKVFFLYFCQYIAIVIFRKRAQRRIDGEKCLTVQQKQCF